VGRGLSRVLWRIRYASPYISSVWLGIVRGRQPRNGEGAFVHGIANNSITSPAPTPPSNSSTSSPSAGHTSASYPATAEAVLWATLGSSSTWISRRFAGARTAVCHSYVTPSQWHRNHDEDTWKVTNNIRLTSTTENTSSLSRQQSAAATHSSLPATSPRSTRRRRSRMSRLLSGKGWLGHVYMFLFNKDDLHSFSALSW
jgi:hypothetical protein